MLDRPDALSRVKTALRRSQVVLVLGPRQSGKTTLARGFVKPDSPNYFDLESPSDAARLAEPMTALEKLKGTVVIDEIQRRPERAPRQSPGTAPGRAGSRGCRRRTDPRVAWPRAW